MENLKEKNIKKYKKDTEKNISDIKFLLEELKMEKGPDITMYQNLFYSSCQFITNNWESGRKYSRTFFVQTAFCKLYPEQFLGFSLSLDVMVNILDDFFDENLPIEKRKNFIIEFLRNFANYNHEKTPKEIKDAVGLYINKLITLALSENVYQKNIITSTNLEEIIDDSFSLLNCRGMDIDIFVEIALINSKINCIKEIKEIGRLFRAINILKKDLADMPYDKENGLESVVIMISDRKDLDFNHYVEKLISLIVEKANIIFKNNSDNAVIAKFYKMIEDEKNKSLEYIKQLNN